MNSVIDATAKDGIAIAKAVLLMEAKGIEKLSEKIDENFIKAVEIINKLEGKVIVTGIGKSGHIACKISATLASTGTPSFFVHPAEASHGDLGMISAKDVVLALSNSGETAELKDIVAYTKRFGIPLISITSKDKSTLSKNSDVTLVLPKADEACPLGLAPTTSTTMMMALGDALAVALLEKKGFSRDDFSVRHPGGKLGQSLLKVEDLMHKGDEMPNVNYNMPMPEALIVMTNKSFGCLCVLDDNQEIIGIITDGDLRRHMSKNMLELKAKDVMTKNPKTVKKELLAVEALRIMNQSKITSLFVDEEKIPCGIIHIHDCLRAKIS
ncbi:MAG: SIS domain-containing protein [Alphaproteobacteria bacterium]